MTEESKLINPWLVAVWPGMGNVAISAGYYLMAKLGMHLVAEFSARELFDVEHVEVKHGLIRTGRLPRSRFFLWRDPEKRHDLIVFIGEAQVPAGRYAFCQKLIEQAQRLGVQRVVTFAAMVTQMQLDSPSRVFGAATDEATLKELKRMELDILEDGQIGGLNGVLLGVAAEVGVSGVCLLGEMPHIFAQLPFPKASLAVLQSFCTMANIELDFGELEEQVEHMGQKLRELLATVQQGLEQPQEEEFPPPETAEEEKLSSADRQKLEALFAQAREDRSKAYELKRELDRLGVFQEYEDRFLDLFKKQQ